MTDQKNILFDIKSGKHKFDLIVIIPNKLGMCYIKYIKSNFNDVISYLIDKPQNNVNAIMEFRENGDFVASFPINENDCNLQKYITETAIAYIDRKFKWNQ